MIKDSFINQGELPPAMLVSIINYLAAKTGLGKLVTISLKFEKLTRSVVQNRYYFGVIIKILAEEIGYTPEVMHDYMKKLFLGYEEYDMPDGTEYHKLKSSTNLSTQEAEEYYRQIREWAKDFLNVFIPLPNETQFNYMGLPE